MSDRPTCRKLCGFPAASAAASSRLTTSYGTAATRAASSGRGRRARKGFKRMAGPILLRSASGRQASRTISYETL